MKEAFERRGFTVTVFENNFGYSDRIIQPVPPAPYDNNPTFHERYESVTLGPHINIEGILKNIDTFQMHVRRFASNPSGILRHETRRHWRLYLEYRRRNRILEDSRLFL